jgi:hypothetical protein
LIHQLPDQAALMEPLMSSTIDQPLSSRQSKAAIKGRPARKDTAKTTDNAPIVATGQLAPGRMSPHVIFCIGASENRIL